MTYYELRGDFWRAAARRAHPDGKPGTAFFDANGRPWARLESIEDKAAAGYFIGVFAEPSLGFRALSRDMSAAVQPIGDTVTFPVQAEEELPLDRAQFLAALDQLPQLRAAWEASHPIVSDLLNSQSITRVEIEDVAFGLRDAGETVEDEATISAALDAATTPPVEPDEGEEWVLGGVYPRGREVVRGGTTYRSRQSHSAHAPNWAPGEPGTLALWEVVQSTPPGGGIPNWQSGVSYALPAQVRHNGVTYNLVQPHTAQPGWEPPNVPALWSPA